MQLMICRLADVDANAFKRRVRNPLIFSSSSVSIVSSSTNESANVWGSHSTSEVRSMCSSISSSSGAVGWRVSKPAMTPLKSMGTI